MAGKDARTWRGIRLFAFWWFGVASPLTEPVIDGQQRKFKTGQRVLLSTGAKWLPGTIGQLGIEATRYEVILDATWRDEDAYWVSDVDIKPVEQGTDAEPWRPTVGDWVRVIESGHVARVHSTEPNGYGELGGVRLDPGEIQKRRRQLWFDASLLEKWVPHPKERVRHHATKVEGTVLRIENGTAWLGGGNAWITEWAAYCAVEFLVPVVK